MNRPAEKEWWIRLDKGGSHPHLGVSDGDNQGYVFTAIVHGDRFHQLRGRIHDILREYENYVPGRVRGWKKVREETAMKLVELIREFPDP